MKTLCNENDIRYRTSAIPDMLLNWYDSYARSLPWRDEPTPYRVWVSEIMLQQTRVSAVIPYFNRFMAALPTIASLADADHEILSKLWEGLGYYSRVRNLHRAAKIVMKDFNGLLPNTPKSLLTLPGIGEYTAGAISSIAFNQAFPAVDGNVLRVFSRLLCCEDNILNASVKSTFRDLISSILPPDRPGDFNQALMELGATVCVPNGSPNCNICPLAPLCKAHELNCEEQFPRKEKKRPRRVEQKHIQIIICDHRVLLTKRPDIGVLSGLWEFYFAPDLLDLEIIKQCSLPPSKHIFTHLEWKMDAVALYIKNTFFPPGAVWANLEEIENKYTIPTAYKTYRTLLPALLT